MTFSRCLGPSLRNAILDGEICAFNHVTESLATKSVQNDIRHIQVWALVAYFLNPSALNIVAF